MKRVIVNIKEGYIGVDGKFYHFTLRRFRAIKKICSFCNNIDFVIIPVPSE